MKSIRNAAKWIFFLNKRLFKRAGFIIILCIVPVMILAMSIVSKQENGVVTVALAAEDPNDTDAKEIIEGLITGKSILRYKRCVSPEQAISLVTAGKADTAWIFDGDLNGKIDKFSADISNKNAFITIVEREETVATQLSRERLYGELYSRCSFALYRNFVISGIDGADELSDAELKEVYESLSFDDGLFKMSFMDGDDASSAASDNYLTAPLRGLLCITVVLSSLAAGMYYLQDETNGVLLRIPRRRRFPFAVISVFVAVFDTAAVMLVSLFASGIATGLLHETVMALLYALAVTGFGMAVRRICGRISVLATVSPVLTAGILGVCPVFVNLSNIYPIQMLLPPYYYLNAVHNNAYIYYMTIYTAVIFAVNYALYRITDKA